ncbi:MAG: FAD/NAD(P)-binding protein [Emcibacteraceae bacterium]
MSSPKHIALVGCGFTGTSAFYQLVDKYPVEEITIFEASGIYGPGLPYKSDECADYLLNNTNDTLCLTPDNRRAFINWLRTNPPLPDGVSLPVIEDRGNISRRYYGYFLEDVFRATLTNAAIKNIKVNLISDEVINISEMDDEKVSIHWPDGNILADKVILTTGHCPGRHVYESPPAGSGTLYFPDHLNEPSLDKIPMEGTIHILGASLSAFDVVGRLYSERTGSRFERNSDGKLEFIPGTNQRHVVLCSRSGRLKKMKSRTPKTVTRKHFNVDYLSSIKPDSGLKLEDIATAIKKDCELNGGDTPWREILEPYEGCKSAEDVDKRAAEILSKDLDTAISGSARNILVDIFGDAGLELWDIFAAHLVSADEEKRFRKNYETATLTYEASCPILTAERLLALHKAGRLKIIKGVKSVTYNHEDDAYDIAHDFGIEKTKILVNSTGSVDRDIKSDAQPTLIKNMAAHGLIAPYKCGGTEMPGADVDMGDFRLLGSKNIHLASMLLWGPGFYTSGAIIMATIVDRILKSLFNE